MIRIGIITAPRPRPTLARSLKSLRAAGFASEVLVFDDGTDTICADNVRTLKNEVRLGNKANWMRALATLTAGYQDSSPHNWIMVCEDDISWAQGAAKELESSLVRLASTNVLRETGAISLYAPSRVTKLAEAFLHARRLGDGWYWEGMQQGKKTWGAQCYLFSWSQAKALLNDEMFRAFASDTTRDKNIDAIVGQCINDSMGKHILYRIPSLVDHDLGNGNSSLGYVEQGRGGLVTQYFRGPRA
jgi:hypothetical protein